MSALNLARWLVRQGHEVGIITAADKTDPELYGDPIEGMRVWRLAFPRPYTFWNHTKVSKWWKPLWYLQDHFDPRNRRLMAIALEGFRPDCVYIHTPAGIGYNSLREIGRRNIPAIYFLHDLSLACLWGGMFKDGKICATRCTKCRVASHIRFAAATSIPALAFCSPSCANLEKAASVLPLEKFKTAAILNANTYPAATLPRTSSNHVRFLYVGRMHATKGVGMLLEVLEKLATSYRFTIDLLGEGADAAVWRARFGQHAWCRFRGHVPQTEVSNYMAQSDMLCTPSIWTEPLGDVVIHALVLGLPVLGSAIGGIPELIEHGKNGQLIPPNDSAAWEEAIRSVLENPAQLETWSAYAKTHTQKFDQDTNGHKILALTDALMAERQK